MDINNGASVKGIKAISIETQEGKKAFIALNTQYILAVFHVTPVTKLTKNILRPLFS